MHINRTVYREDHEMLRETARRFFERECLPKQAQWDEDGQVDRETWLKAGRPPFVNRELLDALEDASHPAVAEVDFREYPPRLEPGMVMQLTIPLPYDEPAWA